MSPRTPDKDMNYEQDYSHTHCYDREADHSQHLRCCICYKERKDL